MLMCSLFWLAHWALVSHFASCSAPCTLTSISIASYLPLISHLRKLLARRRKKSYTISVGKLNPAKLANFLEVECFVLVACPENSLVAGEKV